MKWIFGLCLSFFMLSGALNAQQGFYLGSYNELKQVAKKAEKPYFLYFSASWCKPCKEMERDVFGYHEVTKYIDSHYMAYKIDGEAEYNKPIIKEYWVTAYPTIILFDKDGKELNRIDGYRNRDAFLKELQANTPGRVTTKFSEFR